MIVDVEIGLADFDDGDRVLVRSGRNRDFPAGGISVEEETVVVVKGSELIAIFTRGDGVPLENQRWFEGVIEEEGGGGPRRRATVVQELGSGEGECEVWWGEKCAGEVGGGGGDGGKNGGEEGISTGTKALDG